MNITIEEAQMLDAVMLFASGSRSFNGTVGSRTYNGNQESLREYIEDVDVDITVYHNLTNELKMILEFEVGDEITIADNNPAMLEMIDVVFTFATGSRSFNGTVGSRTYNNETQENLSEYLEKIGLDRIVYHNLSIKLRENMRREGL
jgi:hypothetical protein